MNDVERNYADLPKSREDMGAIIEDMVDTLESEDEFVDRNIKLPASDNLVNHDDF